MTLDLKAAFEKCDDEFLKFERVESPRHPRPDLCAFLMLHDLAPREPNRDGHIRDMISAAEHDEIYLDTDCELLATNATEDDIVTLTRCGIRYDDDLESLCMFV